MQSHASSSSTPKKAPYGKIVLLMHESANQTGEGSFTVDSLESALRQRGLDGHVIELGPADDAAEAAKRAALDKAAVVVAVGGDGTVHDVAKGLWQATREGAQAALGILPAGTMNNIAATLGIPEDVDAALDNIAVTLRSGRFRSLDLARIGEMTFVEEAGFGMLSQLMRIGESVKQNDLAVPAAAVQVGQTLTKYQAAPLTLKMDGRSYRFHALHVLVCNAPVIAMRMNVAPGARMDDGLLDVVVYERYHPMQLMAHLVQRIGGREMEDARVRRFRARSILVEPSRDASFAAWPIEVDGEIAGDCGPDGRWRRIEVHALPQALQLAAPPASSQIEEGALKTAQRAVSSTLKTTPAAPSETAAATTPSATTPAASPPVLASDGVIGNAVGQVAEPPRRAAQRTALVRTLYLIGSALAIAIGVAASRADLLPGDLRLTRALQRTRSPRRDRFWRAVAWAGFPRPTTLVVSVTTLALWITRFRLEALFLLLATGINALNFALKRIVRRKRPTESRVRVLRLIREPSFPSGHVMFYVSAFGFLVAAALANLRPSALRRGIVAVGASLIALVGASRVYLGDHWPSDVVAGYLFGGLYLGGVLELYARAKNQQAHKAPATPGLATPGASANELATVPDIDAAPTTGPQDRS